MEIQEQGEYESLIWDFRRLVGWCKRKRKTILICGAIILVVGLATQTIHYLNTSTTILEPCSFPSDDDENPIQDVSIKINSTIESTSGTSIQSNTFITDKDRVALEHSLRSDELRPREWREIVQEDRLRFHYVLKGRKPKEGGPMQYIITTTYKTIEDTNLIKNFITDNNYKKEWDKSLMKIDQLEVDINTGIEVLHIIKKYPVIGKREYVLASKLWEKEEDKSFLCVTKAWNNEKAPKPTFIKVTHYLSGWRISKAPSGGCEMKIFHQEDIQSWAADYMKDKFTSKIIEYVEETERHLQVYIQQKRKPKEENNAATLAQKF